MACTPRILDLNSFIGSAYTQSADSSAPAQPLRYLLDQLRSKPWRSALGWTVVNGWNRDIDFTITAVGSFTASVVVGTYVSGADLATAIGVALEAAYAPATWTVTYSTTTFKFTIAADVSFSLNFSTTTNATIHPCLGFSNVNVGPGLTFTANTASYQSRHYLAVDFTASPPATTAAIILEDNVSASGTIRSQTSDAAITTALLNPTDNNLMTDRGDYWNVYYSSQTRRYYVFLISDVTNPAGYAEVGIAYLGEYRQPAVAYSTEYAEEGDDLSVVERATQGANLGDLRPEARAWQLRWEEVTDADAAIFRAHRTATPKGKNFFFDFDANTPTIVYGFRDSPLPLPMSKNLYWTPAFVFRESLD